MRKLILAMIIGLVMGFTTNINACDDCYEETNYIMTYSEMMKFDDMIYYDLYLELYCTNYCEDCDFYYYKECMCDSCYDECVDCLEYDYELFVSDNYDKIMDLYEETLELLIENRNNPKVEVRYNYF